MSNMLHAVRSSKSERIQTDKPVTSVGKENTTVRKQMYQTDRPAV